MTRVYLELLDPKRKEVFLRLKPLAKIGGVLAGGTAIFLQTKGRRSFDFDVFFNKQRVREAFKIANEILEIEKKIVDIPGHITFSTKQNVQVTLFHYEFLPMYPLIKTPSLPLFDIRDLAADKAYTMGYRPAWRDYVDIFLLLKDNYVSLGQIINDAQKKFKMLFSPRLFLNQLTYYGDITDFKVEFINQKYSKKEIQSFLKEEVKKFKRLKLGV